MECLSGGVVEAGNGLQEAPFAPRTAKKEAAMANVVLASTPYAAPTPHSEAESGQFESSYSDGASRKAVHAPHSFVRRGEAGTTDTSACTRPTIGVQSSGVGVPTGSSASSFVRQDGEAALHTESAYDAEGASSLPAPSAIIAKQYTEAVTEMEAMQVRLDVAEREAANLREMCVTRDLRCDDLETQLLAKEEQLLRYAQQQQQQGSSSVMERSASLPAGDSSVNGEGRVSSLLKGEPIEACGAESGECLVAPAVQLKPLMAQLTELLVNVRRVQDDYPVDKESLEANDTATPSGKQSPLPTDINYCSARTEHLSLPLSNLEAGGADDATQLSSLVSLVYQAVLKVSQQYAALQAELEVVRADRNELIGEQSEQVRLLQQQLLEKDREQLRLMERVTAADLASRKEADPPEPLKEKSASPVVDDAHDVRDGALSAPLIVPPERAAAEDHSHVLAEQVEKLKVQLAEAKAAAAAAQDAQRNVLTERLERTQTELKQTRLRAEDEYDRLSGTIEMLTRELTDTKEALRIKEVSLRIALRTSSPAMLLAASEEPTGDPASSVCAATATSAPFLTAGLQMTSPLALPPPPVAVQEAAAAATTRSDREDENRRQYSLRTSPSPPPAPLSPSHLRIIVEAEESNGVATVSQSDRASRATSSPPPSPLHHRGKKFVDDGTLRTLPSSVLTEAEGEDSENERLRAARFAVSSSSREKSSRGLTTSTGVESHTPSSSLPRGRSSSSGGGIADSALEHVQSTLTAVRSEGTEQATRNTISGSAGESLSSAVDGAPSGVRESATRQDAALAASPWAKSATGVRRSASARLADALVEEEEELPLPLPLRGPLFRPLPSSLSTASTSLSPHSPHPMESTRAGFRSNTSTSLLPLNSEPQRRQTPRQLSTPSLSLEERLRNFLNSSAGIAAAALDKTAAITGVNQVSASPATRRQTERTSEPDTPISTFKDEQAEMTGHVGARLAVPEDGATPARTPISLLSERMSSTPLWAASTPSSRFGGSPHVSEVAARHTQASLRRHREVWQQQESLLESLLSSPSP
ncbi:hypothetical protein ABB37_06207 [Leptomonas pyrrhocoris]|uniref:Uncharacterized protein n=1 Tax=Leptomonas pyrrhocoris TaxID=157538 RepID=A0A0M9FYL5_LEPPY|nr:hypothetical protein ABB37_06207 [Leptomonas pyrrhocoris]KPA78607.1 hypothetical protein ABB37_06207 [Leptomonas pyrrhocoris]|eukprot:XP_015657046.1 hypothetical protein ABB37_06207 [Leptomonas pyrrhocoris]